MFCEKCGGEIDNNASSCGHCGNSIKKLKPSIANDKNSSEMDEDIPKYKGLRGWLILVGIILSVFTIGLIGSLVRIFMLVDYSGMEELFVYDLITVGGVTIFIMYLIYLFFGKSKKFPRLFVVFLIAFLIINIVTTILPLFYDVKLKSLNGQFVRIGLALLLLIIFGLYVKKSKRVKATFIEEEISKKGLIIGIILTLAIMLGIIFLLADYININNETARNKNNIIETTGDTTIFTDKLLGYEIRYPKGWVVIEHKTDELVESEESDLVTGEMSKLTVANLSDDFLPGIEIFAIKSSSDAMDTIFNKLEIERGYDEVKTSYKKDNLDVYDEKDSEYKSNFRKGEFKVNTEGLVSWIVIIEKENYILKFTFTDSPDNFQDNYELASEILNSLNIFQ